MSPAKQSALAPDHPASAVREMRQSTVAARALVEADAIDIWIARWLRVRRKDLIERYGCDPRRLYEIWTEERFAGARGKAMELFRKRYPGLVDRIDYGRHRRIPRSTHPD